LFFVHLFGLIAGFGLSRAGMMGNGLDLGLERAEMEGYGLDLRGIGLSFGFLLTHGIHASRYIYISVYVITTIWPCRAAWYLIPAPWPCYSPSLARTLRAH